MALRTKAETARYLGVTNQYISTNIERKRLVVTKDGMIDDQNIINKDLISKKLAEKLILPPKQPEKKKRGRKPKNYESIEAVPELSVDASLSLDAQKKQAEIIRIAASTEKLKLEIQKIRGQSIPTELVQGVISALGQSFQTAYKNGSTLLVMNIAHQTRMTSEQETKFKTELIELINESHLNAINEAKRMVKQIIQQSRKTVQDEDEEDS
jgi:hypothetical protein